MGHWVHYEGPPEQCVHCNEFTESAYGDPDEDRGECPTCGYHGHDLEDCEYRNCDSCDQVVNRDALQQVEFRGGGARTIEELCPPCARQAVQRGGGRRVAPEEPEE